MHHLLYTAAIIASLIKALKIATKTKHLNINRNEEQIKKKKKLLNLNFVDLQQAYTLTLPSLLSLSLISLPVNLSDNKNDHLEKFW